MTIIFDETRHDDPAFIKAHIYALKSNLLKCHNELQLVYGELNKVKKENTKLKIELSIHGIELE